MNVEDKITYIILKGLDHQTKHNLNIYRQLIKKVNQVDPASTHIVADTMRLIDLNHNQFLNCTVQLKQQIHPIPNIHSGQGDQWITHIGELELKRLENDYPK